STVGDWLRRQGNGSGLLRAKDVIEEINKKALRLDSHDEYTLFSDPTIIEAEKHDAKMTYLGVKGYRPIITAFKEIPLIVYHSFREGNAVGDVMEAIKRPFETLPKGKRINHASLDSENYRADVMGYLRSKQTTFSIAADKAQAVKELIKRIDNWRPFKDSKGVLTDREIENVIKELKNGIGMEYMPTGDFGANSFWFSLGVLAYNSFIMKKYLILP
ncbi:MAG: hypothetical protein ACK415_13120, partial [Thermodesulfovibrionales bacterium]